MFGLVQVIFDVEPLVANADKLLTGLKSAHLFTTGEP